MSVWFKRVTAEQFDQLDMWFWWRERRTCLWLYTKGLLRDVCQEWYDLRNWFELICLPLTAVLSPITMFWSIGQAKKDRARFGLTLHNQRNIEWLQVEQHGRN